MKIDRERFLAAALALAALGPGCDTKADARNAAGETLGKDIQGEGAQIGVGNTGIARRAPAPAGEPLPSPTRETLPNPTKEVPGPTKEVPGPTKEVPGPTKEVPGPPTPSPPILRRPLPATR